MVLSLSIVQEKSEHLLNEALKRKASDIHIVPLKGKADIQFRVDHGLIDIDSISEDLCSKLVSHFKFLAGMDIGEKRRPQNGSLHISLHNQFVNLRLSTLPTLFQESLVIRILPHQEPPPIQNLVLFQQHAKSLLSLMKQSHGLLILTGPTGSGKTTTLYSLISEARRMMKSKIITLEDPIEQQNDGVLQVQINEKAGITYSAGLKAILRHDPDIIMVGEIRDFETAQAAVRASYTGHLVLTTLHTGSAKEAVYRLHELGISIQDLEQTLIGVVAQRLVKIKCNYCNGYCSQLCSEMRTVRRLGICEILDKENLKQVLREFKGENAYYNYKKLRDCLVKGVALGYVSTEDYGDNLEI